MANLTILSKEVRILDGLYSLNDLHKASGGKKCHQPANFIRLNTTKELIEEIHRSSDLRNGDMTQSANSHFAKYQGGKNQGTWVCKELVYAYAMWISAKFHLQVIRAFDSQVQQNHPRPMQQAPALDYKPNHNIPLNDLIYEIAQLRGVSTEQVRIHYSHVFNSQNWTRENEFVAALARSVLRRDLEAERAKASPDVINLVAEAKERGLMLVDENEYLALRGRLEIQQEMLEKFIDEAMKIGRNNRALLSHGLWG